MSRPSFSLFSTNVPKRNATTTLRTFRVRKSILLTLPPCPDWRKGRVGHHAQTIQPPSEREMVQLALDRLKLRRHESLVQLQFELGRIRQQLLEARMEETNGTIQDLEFNGDVRFGMNGLRPPSIVLGRNTKSLSMENLVCYGMDKWIEDARPGPMASSRPVKEKHHHLSDDSLFKSQREQKLGALKKELEELKVLRLQEEVDMTQMRPFAYSAGNNNGSTLSLLSLDGIGYTKDKPEIAQKIQRVRENALREAHRQNLILELKLRQQVQ